MSLGLTKNYIFLLGDNDIILFFSDSFPFLYAGRMEK